MIHFIQFHRRTIHNILAQKRSIILTFERYNHRRFFFSISSTNLGRNQSRLTSFVLTLAWNMQTTIAFWPRLVFTLCPSSRRFQLRCLAHFFWRSFWSDVYYMFCRLCFNFHGPEGLEDARMSLLFHFLLFSYKIKPILPNLWARIRSWDEIMWSYLTFVWRLQAGNRPVTSG